MKFEVTVEKEGDRYDVELSAPEDAMLYDYIAVICHVTYLLAKNLAEQDGISQEEAERTVFGVVKEIIEKNRADAEGSGA